MTLLDKHCFRTYAPETEEGILMAIVKKKKPEPVRFDVDEMRRRAIAAWLRGGAQDQPGWNDSTVEEFGDKDYVVLRNVKGVMAVYRIRNDGVLKRLKRWPGEVE
jgi:hypothetical protein